MNEVYKLAAGQEDTDGNLLTPSKAIFSAIMTILSDESVSRKIDKLSPDVFYKLARYKEELGSGRFDEFLQSCTMAIFVPTRNKVDSIVPVDAFGETKTTPKFVATPQERQEALRKALGPDSFNVSNTVKRLLAARLQAESFPVTPEFEEMHWGEMDKKLFTA